MNGGNTRKALAALLQRLLNTLDKKKYFLGGYNRVRKLKIKFGNQNKVKTMGDP